MNAVITEHPLCWPHGVPRSTCHRADSFKGWSNEDAKRGVLEELRRLGATHGVVSTDVPLRRDGKLFSNERPADPAAAVFFRRDQRPYAMGCDTYRTTAANLRALALSLAALRTIERHGSTALLERAFSGFAALPATAADEHWSTVLGVPREATLEQVKTAYRALLLHVHPDHGGEVAHAAAAKLNAAMESARKELEP